MLLPTLATISINIYNLLGSREITNPIILGTLSCSVPPSEFGYNKNPYDIIEDALLVGTIIPANGP